VSEALLEVRGLQRHFPSAAGVVRAVDGVDFAIRPGETLGLVGESGCGKSTLSRTIVGLMPATGGSVHFDGSDITRADRNRRIALAPALQMVFQDPYGSLNPRRTVQRLVEEPLLVHRRGGRAERRAAALALLDRVGLPSYVAGRYPHELSGGQRQRVGIARALALGPRLIVCDEPVSALDVSVQAQVLNLLLDLQAEKRLSYLFISHDLSVIRYVAHRIAVMYLGRIVEIGRARDVWRRRAHPYTRALIGAVAAETPEVLKGDLPSPIDLPTGCRFRTRCPAATALCAQQEPPMRSLGDDHFAACHFA
jgi:oligopeptide/dipeptide ABC transporter ATP-binding protein